MAKIRVGTTGEIEEGKAKTVKVNGRAVAIFKSGGAFFAIDDCCPHSGGPLGEGDLQDGAVVCPIHGWTFDLTTGRMAGTLNVTVRTYEITLESDIIYVGAMKSFPPKT